MYNKTTSFLFQKYGEIFRGESHYKSNSGFLNRHTMKLENKEIDSFYCLKDEDIYLKVDEGVALLIVTANLSQPDPEHFVIHHVVKINAGVYFNFLTISQHSTIELSTKNFLKYPNEISTPIIYQPIVPNVSVKEVLSCYYPVRNPNYHFTGETHQYWELTFVDSGHLQTKIEDQEFILKEYDMIFYAPKQFHTQSTNSTSSCSYLTVVFEMNCNRCEKLRNKVFSADKDIIAAINNFAKASNHTDSLSHDLMICFLNEILIRILDENPNKHIQTAKMPMQQKFEDEILNEIMIYINEHVYTSIKIEDLCKEFAISRSSLQQLFNNNLQVAPKQYINNIKLAKAKILIKKSKYTISEISNILGFSSIHYFSRKFKQQFNITPTDYAKTIFD